VFNGRSVLGVPLYTSTDTRPVDHSLDPSASSWLAPHGWLFPITHLTVRFADMPPYFLDSQAFWTYVFCSPPLESLRHITA